MTSFQETPQVKIGHIQRIIASVFGNPYVQKIRKLSLHQKLVLAAISLLLSQGKIELSLSKVNLIGGIVHILILSIIIYSIFYWFSCLMVTSPFVHARSWSPLFHVQSLRMFVQVWIPLAWLLSQRVMMTTIEG